MRRHTLFTLGIASLAIGIVVLLGLFLTPHNLFSIFARQEPPANAGGLAMPGAIPDEPYWIKIPSIKVSAPIQQVGLDAKGRMGIPTNYTDVAWYNQGPKPGEKGSAVIDGHVDTRTFQPGVFRHLKDLETGDIVEIYDKSGNIFQFEVLGKKNFSYDADTSIVFEQNDAARLNLITCTGSWVQSMKQYDTRLVIFTKLKEPPDS